MAEQKISELPEASTLDGSEKVIVNQNGVTSITDVEAIAAYVFVDGYTGSFATTGTHTITVVKGLITNVA